MNNVKMETRSNWDGSQGTNIRSTVEMRGDEQVMDESEIQLTLGPSIYKRSSSRQRLARSNSTVSSKKDGPATSDFMWSFDDSIKNGEDRLEKHTSPWLFQTLSLNLSN